jgi:hypothetical protein
MYEKAASMLSVFFGWSLFDGALSDSDSFLRLQWKTFNTISPSP